MIQPINSTPLLSVSIAQLRESLNRLGFRGKLIDSSLVESASDGMNWFIELTPADQATRLRFHTELLVVESALEDVNKYNKKQRSIVATCTQDEINKSVWQIDLATIRSLDGGVAIEHIESRSSFP